MTTKTCACGARKSFYAVHCAKCRWDITGRDESPKNTPKRRSPEYRAWKAMKQRCGNPNNHKFNIYGARGIRVCERWRDSFETFLADMGQRPHGTSIDRIDNDGNYEPANCRWATPRQQMRNRSNTRLITYDGRTLSLAEWARATGLTEAGIRIRIDRRGWSVAEALTKPLRDVDTWAGRRRNGT